MSWTDPDDAHWDELDDIGECEPPRWPLHWHGLYPRERWLWFERLWADVCMLQTRYHLPLRAGWWTNQIQIEALAALPAWVDRYDSGAWDDPQGKLAVLYDIERMAALLRDGDEPFHPDRDRLAFGRHLIAIGCQPPSPRPIG